MKRLPNENKYQLDVKDQFKNEFEIGQLQGNNFHMTDSADLPMLIEPQGNIEQEVIEAVEGIVVEGSSINVNDVDTSYEDSIMPKGNIEQVVVEEIPGNTIEGEIINITNGDSTKEVKAIVNGNSYQETIAEEVGTTVVNKSIYLTDVNTTKESKLAPNGGIEQDTRVGYNVLDVRGFKVKTESSPLTLDITDNGELIINGTTGNSGNDIVLASNTPLFTLTGDYIYDYKSTENVANMFNTEINLGGYGVGTYMIFKKMADSAKYKLLNFAEPFEVYNINIHFQPNTTFTNYIIKPMIYSGTEVKDFEQYGAMPSLQFPSEVKGVGSEKNINLVDVQEVSTKSYTKILETNLNYIIVEQESATKLATMQLNVMNLKAGVTYTVKRKIEVLSSYKDTDTGNVEIYLGSKWKKVILPANKNEATFTVDEDGEYKVMLKVAQINVSTATIPVKVKFYDVMVYEGTEDLPYTPYGYCRYDTVVGNKNFFSADKLLVENNVIMTKITNGVRIASKSTGNTMGFAKFLIADLTNFWGKNITVKANLNVGKGNCKPRFLIALCDKNGNVLTGTNAFRDTSGSSFTTNFKENTTYHYLCMNLYVSSSATDLTEGDYVDYTNIQIELGDTATEIVEHQSQTLPIDIPIGQEWYSGKPYKENGKWYRKEEYEKIIFNGTEDYWLKSGNYEGSYYFDTQQWEKASQWKGKLYCNMAKQVLIENYAKGTCLMNYQAINIWLDNTSEFSTLELWKNWLAEQYANGTPLYIVYELATPIVEEITDTHLIEQLQALEKAEFYNGATNINSYRSSDDVAEMPLEAHYNFITPSPSVERLSDIEVIDGVNRFDGEIELGNIVNGANATHAEVYRSKNYIKVKPNTPYAFSLNGKLNRVIICMYDKDKNYIGLDEVGLQVTNGLFTTYANAEYLRFRSYGADVVIIQTAKIQLNEGSTVKLYLPYGHIGLLQRNQQLYDYTKPVTVSSQGVTVDDDGWVTMNYDNTSGTSTVFLNYFSRKLYGIKNSTKYAVVIEIKNVSGNASLVVASSDANVGQFKWQGYELTTLANNSIKIGTLTSVDNLEILASSVGLRTYMHIQAGKTANMTFRLSVMRNLDVTAETFKYEEYKENLIPIDLQGNTLAKLDDTVRDLLNIGLDGSVSITKKTKEYVFTGYETFFNNQNAIGLKYFNNQEKFKDNGYYRVGYMNYFKSAVNGLWDLQEKEDLFTFASSELNRLAIMSKNHNTIEEFKAWLKELYDNGIPVKILYGLAKEYVYTIQLPSIEPIKLFEGTNNFELVTNLDTTLNMTYNHVGYSPSIVKPSEVKGVGSEEDINLYKIGDIEETTKNGVTYSIKNGRFKANGTATNAFSITTSNVRFDLKSGEYTFGAKDISGTYSGTIGKYVIRTGGTNVIDGDLIDRTVRKTLTEDDLNVCANIFIANGATFNNYEASLLLVKGTYQTRDAMPLFTPYGYCRYENIIENRNRFNINAEPFSNTKVTKTVIDNGIRITATSSGTWLGSLFDLGELSRLAGKTIRINAISSVSAENLPYLGIGFYRKDTTNRKSVISNANIGNMSLTYKIAPQGDFTHLYVSFSANSTGICKAGDYTDFTNIIITIDDTDTSYIEHQEQNLPIDIPVGQEWYSGKPYKLNGKWYRDEKFKLRELTGNETFLRTGTNNGYYYFFSQIVTNEILLPNSNSTIANIYSNKFKAVSCASTGVYGGVEGIGVNTNGQISIYSDETKSMTVEEFKEWLKTAGIYFVYETTNPQRIEITDTHLIEQLEALQNAEFYDGVTNINSYRSSEDVAEMPLEAHYNFITPAPSIDRPSEVLEVGSEEDINLLNLKNGSHSANNGSVLTVENGKCNTVVDSSVTSNFGIGVALNEPYKLLAGQEYTLINGLGTAYPYIGLRKYKDTGVSIVSTGYDDNGLKVFTVEEDVEIGQMYAYHNYGNSNINFYPMLLKGRYTKADLPSFTPYGYCRYNTKIENKNILPNELKTQTINGITATVFEDGSINFKGTSTSNATFYLMTTRKNFLKSGVQYTLSTKNDVPENVFLRLVDGSSMDKYYQVSKTGGTNNKNTFINSKIDAEIRCFVYFGSAQTGSTYDFTIYPMLEEGKTATEYTPHKKQLLPIDLPIGMKMYNNEFFYKENGKWWRSIKYVKSKLTSDMEWYLEVFDGIGRPRTDDFADIIKNVSAVNTVRVYSNYFKQNYGNNDYVFGKLKVGYLGFYTNKQLYLTTYFKNVNDWKTYLDENDVYIVFEIEPYPEEITDANLIAQLEKTLTPFSYYPVTNINSYKPTENVADLKLYVEYFKSNKITNK